MQKPNFFIIGTPKCATTGLATYLREHKDIFFSDPKEPRYFSTDFPEKHRRISTLEEYEKLFEDADGFAAVGEGSAYYLFSAVAVPNILKYNPDAKFIVLVKDPMNLAKSWHKHLVHNGYENTTDFEKALATDRNKSALTYKEIMAWPERIEWVKQHIPEGRLLVCNIDTESMASIYRRVLAFLGVEDDGRTHFPRINKGKPTSLFRRILFNLQRLRRKYKIAL